MSIDRDEGLVDVVAFGVSPSVALKRTLAAGVSLMTAGSRSLSPLEIFESDRFGQVLEALTLDGSVVFLILPPEYVARTADKLGAVVAVGYSSDDIVRVAGQVTKRDEEGKPRLIAALVSSDAGTDAWSARKAEVAGATGGLEPTVSAEERAGLHEGPVSETAQQPRLDSTRPTDERDAGGADAIPAGPIDITPEAPESAGSAAARGWPSPSHEEESVMHEIREPDLEERETEEDADMIVAAWSEDDHDSYARSRRRRGWTIAIVAVAIAAAAYGIYSVRQRAIVPSGIEGEEVAALDGAVIGEEPGLRGEGGAGEPGAAEPGAQVAAVDAPQAGATPPAGARPEEGEAQGAAGTQPRVEPATPVAGTAAPEEPGGPAGGSAWEQEPISGPGGPYRIFVTSHTAERAALVDASTLSARGFESEIVVVDLGEKGIWHRVAVRGGFPSVASGSHALERVREAGYPSAWIQRHVTD
jgi:hypothetical protein